MAPSEPLPYHSHEFNSADEYVNSLLNFSTSSVVFKTLCGGVHIVDFFTTQKQSLFHGIIPQEWQVWLLSREPMALMDFLLRDDLDAITSCGSAPKTLIDYVREIRRHNLHRNVSEELDVVDTKLPRHIAIGMIPKKIHEVRNFARYVTRVADEIQNSFGREVTHFVDLGSGQNYLGRTLVSSPYNKQVIAVENRILNINVSKNMDVLAQIAKRENVMRNKKLYRRLQANSKPMELLNPRERKIILEPMAKAFSDVMIDLRPSREIKATYTLQDGIGNIQYIHNRIENGDFSEVIKQIDSSKPKSNKPASAEAIMSSDLELKSPEGALTSEPQTLNLMSISIHSCGNLSHHGIRSLLLNDQVQAIAIIGCCYNLLSDRLNPCSLKHPLLRLNQHPINASNLAGKEASTDDLHGFPMSKRVATHNGNGIRLNITSRMMAVQAPGNWKREESDSFFTRHFFRALAQRIFLDYGVVQYTGHDIHGASESTEPIIIGNLRKKCYKDFRTYVRGAIEKICCDPERGTQISEKLTFLTDEQIDEYFIRYEPLKRELSVTWSLMAFSASVVECLIVVDRWLFLTEHPEVVQKCWVEPVFDYRISPRNLVVVGIKR